MRALDAGWLLSAISRGGAIDLPRERESELEALIAAGLVRRAEDPGPLGARHAQARAELAQSALARRPGEAISAAERAARAELLALSERLAEAESAAEIRVLGGGGAYRETGHVASRVVLTQRGRVLVGDLAPRQLRVGERELETFEADMQALRDRIAHHARRAAEVAKHLAITSESDSGMRAAPVGLALSPHLPMRTAAAFKTIHRQLETFMGARFSVAQDAAAAECMVLAAGMDLPRAEREDNVRWLEQLRDELLAKHSLGAPEDALDAAILLLGAPQQEHAARIRLATELAFETREAGVMLPLPVALLLTLGGGEVPQGTAGLVTSLDTALSAEVVAPRDRATIAGLLAFPGLAPEAQLEKWRVLRQYLARYSADGMSVAAALLTWLALDPAEILDTVRLASTELSSVRAALGGAEAMTLAIKLVLAMAFLAAGSEGDPEESLALAPIAHPRIRRVWLGGAIAALPLAGIAVEVFQRTVLDAAAEYDRLHQPTHGAYVHGGHYRSGGGWG